jgi:hypothetical protein
MIHFWGGGCLGVCVIKKRKQIREEEEEKLE